MLSEKQKARYKRLSESMKGNQIGKDWHNSDEGKLHRKRMSELMKGNKHGLGWHPSKEQSEKQSRSVMKKDFRTKGLSNDEILFGLLLSDAHVTKIENKFRNSKFQMSQSTKYEEMIDFTSKYLNDLGFDTTRKTFTRKTGISSINLMTKVYPDFTELRKIWYPDNIKIVPRMLKLTPKSLAFWMMGDGTSRWAYKRFIVEVQLCTESFSISDCLFLKDQLEQLGIVARIKPFRKGYRILIKSKKDVIQLMTLIKPYVTIPCFYYKVKMPELSNHFNAYKPESSKYKSTSTETITSE